MVGRDYQLNTADRWSLKRRAAGNLSALSEEIWKSSQLRPNNAAAAKISVSSLGTVKS